MSELDDLLGRWSAALDGFMTADLEAARTLLDRRLSAAASADEHGAVREQLLAVVSRAEQAAAALRGLVDHADSLHDEWEATRRLTPAGIAQLHDELVALSATDPETAARRWVRELEALLLAGEGAAAVALSAAPLALSDTAARDRLHALLARWGDGDAAAGAELLGALADGELGHALALDDPARADAQRLAAALSANVRGDIEAARGQIEAAVALNRWDADALAERGALALLAGEPDRAATDARRAIEAGATAGYLLLAACTEHGGDFANADALYRQAFERMTPFELAHLQRRVTLLRPTGRLLLRLGERLLDLARPDAALVALDAALALPFGDPRPYPAADVQRRRSHALEHAAAGSPRDAALAAFEAGKLDLWNNDPERAEAALRRALALDDSLPGPRWFLADTLVAFSFPVGAASPDQERVAAGRTEFNANQARFGWPDGEFAWALGTRALIADYEAYRPDADRVDAVWAALTFIERGLVHDPASMQFWAGATRYLRWQRLDELALECVQRARELGARDPETLGEYMALLANRGRYDEADATARELDALAPSPWVSGVRAWLALRLGRPAETLELLKPALAVDYDIAWYLDVATNANLALGDLDAARACLRDVLARAQTIEPATRLSLARAEIVVGDPARAEALLAAARADPVLGARDIEPSAALLALARGDAAAAVAALGLAAAACRYDRELDELVQVWPRSIALLDAPADVLEGYRRDVLAGIADAVAARRAEFAAAPPTADRELEHELADQQAANPGGRGTLALLAVRARRRLEAGAAAGAAEDYERLLGSEFGPEAARGLALALDARSRGAAAGGDVDAVRAGEARLVELGATTATEAAIMVARALVQAGRGEDARAELTAALAGAADERERNGLHDELGLLALRGHDAAAADEQFRLAEATNPPGDFTRLGRLAVKRCLCAALTGDSAAMLAHLRRSLQAWRDAGAYEPDVALRQALTATLESEGIGAALPAGMHAAVADALKTLEAAGELRPHVTETLISATSSTLA